MPDYLLNDQIGSDPEASASDRFRQLHRQFCIWKKLQVIRIWNHHRWIVITQFSDRGALRYIVLSISQILSAILVINIGGALDFLLRYPRLLIRKFDFEIQIHMAS